MIILLVLVAAATVTAYAEEIFTVRYAGKSRALHEEESVPIDFSLPLTSFTGSFKIDEEVFTSDAQGSPSTSSLQNPCDELLHCMEILTGAPVDFYGTKKDDVCDSLLDIYQGNEGVTAICDVALLPQEPCKDCGPSEVNIETIPTTCKPKADVVYYDDSGENTGYDTAVASIVGTFIKTGKRARTDADAVAFLVIIALGIAREAVAAAEACGCIAEGVTVGVCLVVKVAAAVTLAALEITTDQINFHDSGIDGSEILATFQNTNNIVDQTCTITGMIDELLCPWGHDGSTFTVLRQGCDATDQNCNGEVDECAEDNVPPSLTLHTTIPDKPFKNTDEARRFLQENLIVSDDCAVNFETDIRLPPVGCCNCVFTVTTVDTRCAGITPTATVTKEFTLKVDSAAPVISCGFFVQQDPFHVLGGFDLCGGQPVPFPGVNDPLHIDKSSVGQGLFNVGLWYQIEDECDKEGVLPVTVQVLSNELAKEEYVWIVERNDLPNKVHRAEVYLSPTSCHDDSSSSSICELEETEDDSITTRFYDVAISATDDGGNTGTKICSVIVIPDNHYDVDSIGKSGKSGSLFGKSGKSGIVGHDPNDLREEYKLSTKRYVISELSLEWNPNLNTTLVPPPRPEPDINSKSGKGFRNVLCDERGSISSKSGKGSPDSAKSGKGSPDSAFIEYSSRPFDFSMPSE